MNRQENVSTNSLNQSGAGRSTTTTYAEQDQSAQYGPTAGEVQELICLVNGLIAWKINELTNHWREGRFQEAVLSCSDLKIYLETVNGFRSTNEQQRLEAFLQIIIFIQLRNPHLPPVIHLDIDGRRENSGGRENFIRRRRQLRRQRRERLYYSRHRRGNQHPFGQINPGQLPSDPYANISSHRTVYSSPHRTAPCS